MPSEKSHERRPTVSDKRRKEGSRNRELFEDAFDELHKAVVKHVNTPGQYVGVHHDYPVMTLQENGFPAFHALSM